LPLHFQRSSTASPLLLTTISSLPSAWLVLRWIASNASGLRLPFRARLCAQGYECVAGRNHGYPGTPSSLIGLISRPATSYRGGFCAARTLPNPTTPGPMFHAAADCSWSPIPSGAATPSRALSFLLIAPLCPAWPWLLPDRLCDPLQMYRLAA
jgi:hypothetical protein